MAQYTGKTVRVNMPAEVIADKFSDLSQFDEFKDRIPADQLAQIGDLKFEKDSIILKNPAIGEMAFNIVERTPEKVVFKAEGMISLEIVVGFKPVTSENSTDVSTVLDIDIPMMLRPMIGGKLQQVADSFSDLIGKLASGGSL